MKKLALSLLIILSAELAAQKDSSITLQYISAGFHLNINSPVFAAQEDLASISKEPNFYLDQSTKNYKLNNFGHLGNRSGGGSINIGLQLIPKLPNSITRLSLALEENYFMYSSYYNDSSKYIGKVTSVNPSFNSFYIYEKKTSTLSYQNRITNMGISLAQLFQTNRQKYVSFYAGLMLSFNASVQSEIQAYSFTYSHTTQIDSITGKETYGASYPQQFTSGFTRSKAEMFIYTSIGLPVGVELRFSKKRKRLKHFSMICEVIPQTNLIVSPNIPKQRIFSYRVTPLNLIYRF